MVASPIANNCYYPVPLPSVHYLNDIIWSNHILLNTRSQQIYIVNDFGTEFLSFWSHKFEILSIHDTMKKTSWCEIRNSFSDKRCAGTFSFHELICFLYDCSPGYMYMNNWDIEMTQATLAFEIYIFVITHLGHSQKNVGISVHSISIQFFKMQHPW